MNEHSTYALLGGSALVGFFTLIILDEKHNHELAVEAVKAGLVQKVESLRTVWTKP